MYFPTVEQLGQMRAANVSTAWSFTQQTFQGIEELIGLNLAFVKQTFPAHERAARAFFSDKTPVEVLIDQANQVRPLAEKVLAHHRHAFDITLRTHAALLDVINARLQRASPALASA